MRTSDFSSTTAVNRVLACFIAIFQMGVRRRKIFVSREGRPVSRVPGVRADSAPRCAPPLLHLRAMAQEACSSRPATRSSPMRSARGCSTASRPCEITVADNDVMFKLIVAAGQENLLALHIDARAEALRAIGCEQVVERVYPGMKGAPVDGYSSACVDATRAPSSARCSSSSRCSSATSSARRSRRVRGADERLGREHGDVARASQERDVLARPAPTPNRPSTTA